MPQKQSQYMSDLKNAYKNLNGAKQDFYKKNNLNYFGKPNAPKAASSAVFVTQNPPPTLASVIKNNINNINKAYKAGGMTEAQKNYLLNNEVFTSGKKVYPKSPQYYTNQAQTFKQQQFFSDNGVNYGGSGGSGGIAVQAPPSQAAGNTPQPDPQPSNSSPKLGNAIAGGTAAAVFFGAAVLGGTPPLKAALVAGGAFAGQWVGGIVGTAIGGATSLGLGAPIGGGIGSSVGALAGGTAGANLYDFLFGKNDNPQLQAVLQNQAPEPKITSIPLFKGGQCKILYEVYGKAWDSKDGSFGNAVEQKLAYNIIGPVGGIRLKYENQDAYGSNSVATQILCHGWAHPAAAINAGYQSYQEKAYWQTIGGSGGAGISLTQQAAITRVVPLDGALDNCGDLKLPGGVPTTVNNIVNNYTTNNFVIQSPPYSPAGSIFPSSVNSPNGSTIGSATGAAAAAAVGASGQQSPKNPSDKIPAPPTPKLKVPPNTPFSVGDPDDPHFIVPPYNQPVDLAFPSSFNNVYGSGGQSSPDQNVDDFLKKVGTPFQIKKADGTTQTFISPGGGAVNINIPGMQPITYDPTSKPPVKDAFKDLIDSGTYVPKPLQASDPFTAHPLTPTVLKPSLGLNDKTQTITLTPDKPAPKPKGKVIIDGQLVDADIPTKPSSKPAGKVIIDGQLVDADIPIKDPNKPVIKPNQTPTYPTIAPPIPKIPGLTDQQVIIDALLGIGIVLQGIQKGNDTIQKNTSPPEVQKAVSTGVCNTLKPGGCMASMNQNAANAANNSAANNATLNNLANVGELGASAEILARLGPQLPGGISGFLQNFFANFEKLAKWLHLDRVLNVLTFTATLHNAYMLSNGLSQTFFSMISNVLAVVGIKDKEDSPLDISKIVGGKIESFFKAILGVETVDGIKSEWKKYNRIYQAAANLLWSVQSIGQSILSALEIVGQWSASVANALRKWGVVAEHAYRTFNPEINFPK